MKKTLIWLLLLCLVLPAALAENISFSGTVVPRETVVVYVHSSALVDDVPVKPGDAVGAGDTLATLRTDAVYAPVDGTVAAICGKPGDDAADVATRWGSVIALEEAVTFTVSADNTKAYDDLAAQNVTLGEAVWVQSRSDERRTGQGVIASIDNTAYTIRGTSGTFAPGESVSVHRAADFSEESCLGRGTVARVNPTAISGEGTIVSVEVTAGQQVSRGDLLFRTLPGSGDSDVLTAPISGVVAQVNLVQGSAAEENSAAFVLYPEDAMRIEAAIPEADLAYLCEGDRVSIAFLWNEDFSAPVAGEVLTISALPDENGAYTAAIAFSADETVRYGMSVTITPESDRLD